MTGEQAKKILEMMFEGKDKLPKKVVFEIIDMIDVPVNPGTSLIEYPIIRNPEHISWWNSWTNTSPVNLFKKETTE